MPQITRNRKRHGTVLAAMLVRAMELPVEEIRSTYEQLVLALDHPTKADDMVANAIKRSEHKPYDGAIKMKIAARRRDT